MVILNRVAAGGVEALRAAGVDVVVGLGRGPGPRWQRGLAHGRTAGAVPTSLWKLAATLDGRVAAADGSSRWITGRGRAGRRAPASGQGWDAILVGTGTALADDPRLTARATDGPPTRERDGLRRWQRR